MAKVLFIKTSMTELTQRGSISEYALDIYKDLYKKMNPTDELFELNLNNDPVGSASMNSNNFASFFDTSDKYIDQLKGIDKLILASPMTNFNYPATLKNYLDHILVAGKTFKYKYDGKGEAIGLLKNLKVQLITTQGAPKGWYPFGDHTISLNGTFKFMGANVVEPVIIAGTKTPSMIKLSREEVVDKYMDDIKKAVKTF